MFTLIEAKIMEWIKAATLTETIRSCLVSLECSRRIGCQLIELESSRIQKMLKYSHLTNKPEASHLVFGDDIFKGLKLRNAFACILVFGRNFRLERELSDVNPVLANEIKEAMNLLIVAVKDDQSNSLETKSLYKQDTLRGQVLARTRGYLQVPRQFLRYAKLAKISIAALSVVE